MSTRTRRLAIAVILVLLLGGAGLAVYFLSRPQAAVRVGYFHGRRTYLLFRTYINDCFEKNGVKVTMFSQFLHWPGFFEVPRDYQKMWEKLQTAPGGKSKFGLTSGMDIIDAITIGFLDGGVVGEASFVASATQDSPLVAVAMLGHYTTGFPGRALVLRNDVRIDTPDDFKGKIFATRRSGPGDGMLLREYFTSIGLDPDKDVVIIDQIQDDQQEELIQRKVVHGYLAHFGKLDEPQRLAGSYIYRMMDWVDPQTEFALLVFRRDYLERHREEIIAMLVAYMQRKRYEETVPDSEKRKEHRHGMRMLAAVDSLRLPEYDDPPAVRMPLLEEVQRLLLKHHYLNNKVDLAHYVDLTIVEEAARRVGPAAVPSPSP